ncbi:MAG: hypothetical protein AAFY63_00035 [Cyanobacteria bacterium J06643_13]
MFKTKQQAKRLLLISVVGAGIIHSAVVPEVSKAQTYPSISQMIAAAKNKCTFQKKEVTTYKDENGVEQTEIRNYSDLSLNCTRRVYRGQLVQNRLRFDRANDNIFSGGAVVTFKGDGFTAYCRDAGAETVKWFRKNSTTNREFIVTATYKDLESRSEINIRNCEYFNP